MKALERLKALKIRRQQKQDDKLDAEITHGSISLRHTSFRFNLVRCMINHVIMTKSRDHLQVIIEGP